MRELPSPKEFALFSIGMFVMLAIALPEITIATLEIVGVLEPGSPTDCAGSRPSMRGTDVLAVLHERFDLPGTPLGKMTPADLIDCFESVYPTSVHLAVLERARQVPNIPAGDIKRLITLALRNYEPTVRRRGLLLLGSPPRVPIKELLVYLETDKEEDIRESWLRLREQDPSQVAKRLRSRPAGVDDNFSVKLLK